MIGSVEDPLAGREDGLAQKVLSNPEPTILNVYLCFSAVVSPSFHLRLLGDCLAAVVIVQVDH